MHAHLPQTFDFTLSRRRSLGKHTLNIHATDLRTMHDTLEELYPGWAEARRADGNDFFAVRRPVILFSRYGQDEEILRGETPHDDFQEAVSYTEHWNFEAIEFWGYAIAITTR